MSDLAHIHCSPPCETYSRTDATNQYRDPPCNYRVLATGEPTSRVGEHRNKAIEHDNLVNHVLGLLRTARKEGGNFTFSIENPRGMLRKRSFMACEKWPLELRARRVTVDYCAYAAPYRKTTDIWTDLHDWEPCGSTGDGRCHHRCGQGGWGAEIDGRRSFYHHKALAGQPIDGVQGVGSKQYLSHIPSQLCDELLQVEGHPYGKKGVVLDLCCGWGSMEKPTLASGRSYLGIDLRMCSS